MSLLQPTCIINLYDCITHEENMSEDTMVKNQPIHDICINIIRSSYECSEGVKHFINIQDDKKRQEAEIYVFYEFIYFFMHITNRAAFATLTKEQRENFQEIIGPIIVSTAIDSFFAHWPEKIKNNMTSEFYEKLNDQELEYSIVKKLFSKDNPFGDDSLFSILARNICELSGNKNNPIVMVEVLERGIDCYKKINLDVLMKEVKDII